ncbi:MAG: GNAT family N-acetyltransferase, partial [Phycisphaeraceae bacterium]
MELPIAQQSYQPSADALVRAIKQADVILVRMAATETPLDGATVYVNADRPAVRMVNCAVDVRIPEGGTATGVFDQVVTHFDGAGTSCFSLQCNETVWPEPLAQQIEARGYRAAKSSVYLLADYTPPDRVNPDLQVIPGRAAYPQLRDFYKQAAIEQHGADQTTAADLAATHIDHLDEPRSEVFFGRLADRGVGQVNLVTLGQIGVIEWLYTAAEARNQGVATTLLAHALDHCRRAL